MSGAANSFKQRRKTTPNNLFLTTPKPFKSLTNTYDSQKQQRRWNQQNVNSNGDKEVHLMDCRNSEGKKGNTGINASKSFSSSTLPFCERSQKGNANSFGVFTASNKHQIPPSPTSEPPPILPKRYLRLAKH